MFAENAQSDKSYKNSKLFTNKKLPKILFSLFLACGGLIATYLTLSFGVSITSAASNDFDNFPTGSSAPQTLFTVTNNNDSGAGSLRQAIIDAQDGDTITFAPNVSGTIELTSGELSITENLTLTGPGSTIMSVSGNNASRVFFIDGAIVVISGLTIRDGNTVACGGGICASAANLTLSDTVVISNAGGLGGGISNYGTLTLINSSIVENSSIDTGGGINNLGELYVSNSVISGNLTLTAGGGINNSCASANSVILDTTIANNHSAQHAGGMGICTGTTAVITNTTFSGNTSDTGGGGLDVYGTVTIFNSTIVNNSAVDGGGIRNLSGSTMLKNSIVANNTSGGDCAGTVQSNGRNLSSSNTCDFTNAGDIQNIDPQIGPLTDNGGRTPTHLLLAGSPAINAGDNVDCPTFDQRGVGRPQAGICDIGAVELALPNSLYLPLVFK
ncbi:MAG: hypothetical protein IPJ90_02670 [Anaerolineaceae bacterium]|nr:hypothetical protein [Anaerolineaceae bacterium]